MSLEELPFTDEYLAAFVSSKKYFKQKKIRVISKKIHFTIKKIIWPLNQNYFEQIDKQIK
jgi:hypothetical protein